MKVLKSSNSCHLLLARGRNESMIHPEEMNACLVFSIDLQRGKVTIKRVEELNYKYSKRLQVDLLRDSGEVCR